MLFLTLTNLDYMATLISGKSQVSKCEKGEKS